ncbi:MAG TPA: PAS domain S-box protein [Candidatus Polarisedimenticolia bacterium]|nr:PAS domain S-box protein [Candidatus Polarisedimenticolia bacterium]
MPGRQTLPAADTDFRLLFSRNPQPMYVYDRQTLRFLEVNDAAVKVYGYSRDGFLRMQIQDICSPDEVACLLEVVRGGADSVEYQGHWRHRRENGDLFDAEVISQRILFAGRDATLVVARDISLPCAAQERAAERTAFLQALTENNPLAIVVLDTGRRVQMCNPAFERLFGCSRAEIMGSRLEELVDLPTREKEPIGLVGTVECDGTVCTTAQRRRRDGSIVMVRIIGVPLIVDGKRVGSFAMYEDITKQSRIEAEKRRAEEKYRRMFENAVEGIFESTHDGRFVAVNPALARMAGYSSPSEMIGAIRNIGEQLYANPEELNEIRRRLQERDTVEAFECQMLRKDGSKLWISMNVRQIRNSRGEIVARNGTAEDITQRKRSQLERQVTTDIIHAVSVTDNLDDLLRLIHGALRQVLDAENCFVALYDSSSGMFHFPFFVDKFDQVSPPQEMERSCTAYVFRTGRAMVMSQELFDQLAARGEVELVGTPSPSWLGVPLRTPAKTIGVLVVQNYETENVYTERDLEFLASVGGQIALAIERKRSEESLRQSEARLRVLIEQLPAVLWTVDNNLRLTSGVGSGLARLGLKPNQLVGVSLSEYFGTSDETHPPIVAHLRAIAGEPVTYHHEWKGGSYACHVEPLRGAGGEVQGAIGMALDVTDRKKLEEQFRQSQKMEAVGRLAGGIAHDFNNLLMVIQGYADLMAEQLPADDSLRRKAEQIQTAAQRATSLTQQLLAFSRRQMLAPKVLNVQGVVADMEKILRRLIGEDIELQTFSEPDLWLVKADRSQIEQVIMNLAVNARDAMARGGRLTIETANVDLDGSTLHPPAVLPGGKYVMLAVTDNGCGMDAETQAHIFEPFFTTKEKGKGTGLGLATVYGIVKQSGGYIWVYSELDHGTTFKIYLPKTEVEIPAVVRDRPVDTRSLPRGSEVVLLVEDETGVRELARQYLEMSGYTVLEAEDGHTGLELAGMHAGPIHLLLTDVVMPGLSGRELADRVTAIRPGIKVVYMSGYTDQAAIHHGILEGDAILLQKPFTLAALAAKLREILAVETTV